MGIETIITTIIGLAGMSWIIVELLKLSKSVGRIEGRLDKVELRLDNVDKRLDNMDKKFDNIDKRFEALPCSIHLASITELQMNLLEITTFLVLLLATGNDMFNQIKVKVYHYPSMDIINRCGQTERYDVSLDDVCFALSLKLRDKYLETHPSVMV